MPSTLIEQPTRPSTPENSCCYQENAKFQRGVTLLLRVHIRDPPVPKKCKVPKRGHFTIERAHTRPPSTKKCKVPKRGNFTIERKMLSLKKGYIYYWETTSQIGVTFTIGPAHTASISVKIWQSSQTGITLQLEKHIQPPASTFLSQLWQSSKEGSVCYCKSTYQYVLLQLS